MTLKRGNRRGVLILIVLSILVMFGLMAITFVLITGQNKRTSLVSSRSEQYFEPPDRITHEAALTFFRGTNNLASAVGVHNLLEDMYGDEIIAGTTTAVAVTPVCNWQLINIAATGVTNPGTRVGCVLTMLNGPAALRSTRIVGYTPPPGNLLQIVAFDDVPASAWTALPAGTVINYVINGAAFTGTGVGYNPNSGRLDLAIDPTTGLIALPPTPTSVPMAWLLRPFLSLQELQAYLKGPDRIANDADDRLLMANPDYTAADQQHPFLAIDGTVPIPSFHRPVSANALFALMQSDTGPITWGSVPNTGTIRQDAVRGISYDPQITATPDLIRQIVNVRQRFLLRPMPADHPGFTGSNLSPLPFDPTSLTGPWDVDTDGTGTANAIWTDIGLPVRSMPDGRLVKPLVAARIVDLDGRLNVNAHGTYAQTEAAYYGAVDPTAAYYKSWDPTASWSATANFVLWDSSLQALATPSLPRGFGYGPAEINLAPLFGVPTVPATLTAYNALLTARYTGINNPTGVPGSNDPADDPLHLNKWFDYIAPGGSIAGGYWDFTNGGMGVYGTPPNRLGGGALALDPAGRPLYLRMGGVASGTNNHERLNDPYKMNLSKPTAVNTPFGPADQEAILRQNDYDAPRLPTRLTSAPTDLRARRTEVTTASWHVPAPTFFLPKHLLGSAANPGTILGDLPTVPQLQSLLPGRSIQDLLTAKFYVRMCAGNPGSAATLTSAQTLAQTALSSQWVPVELSLRVKMDLNRPFGNGQDNTAQLYQWTNVKNGAAWQSNPVTFSVDPLNNIDPGAAKAATWPMDARQLYARHLYVLAMLLTDLQTAYPGLTPDQRARMVAQWAINVVSFRDRSPVMPYFEYDPDPFTSSGWRVNGNPTDNEIDAATPNPYVVWGCKRPQLLMTETLALHARRTEDLNTEDIINDIPPPSPARGKGAKTTDVDPKTKQPPGDNDFDQRLRPLGSLFVELYSPANPLDADLLAGEVYNPGTGQWSGGIYLNLGTAGLNQPPSSQNHPVWRLIVVNPRDPLNANKSDADDPQGSMAIERSVYFMNPVDGSGAPLNLGADGQRYWTSGSMSPILHDRYAVIGPPGDVTLDASGTLVIPTAGTPISRRMDGGKEAQCQQIVLNPSANPQVQFQYSQTDTPNDLTGWTAGAVKPPVAVVVDQPRRLSVSEPVGGYPTTNPDGTAFNGQQYVQPYDHPFDTAPELITDGMTLATQKSYKVVYLQRLANPSVPFDPVTNPYRTIDSMPVDLFAYNGIEDPSIPEKTPTPVVNQIGQPGSQIVFHSRERGDGLPLTATGFLASNIWASESPIRPAAADTAPLHTLNLQCGVLVRNQRPNLALQQTLGLLNKPFFPNEATPWSTPPSAEYLGDVPVGVPPDALPPVPSLIWNSRPFVSELELPLVPYASSSNLLKTVWFPSQLADPTKFPPLPPGVLPPNGVGVNGGPSGPGFPYLWDFFTPATTTPVGPEFYRLLELVGVPSPYVGTELQGNPTFFSTGSALHTFYPPFNRIPNYREPGRVNLNTLVSSTVWQGVMPYNSTLYAPGFFNTQFANSRNASPFRSYMAPFLTSGPTGIELGATLLRPTDPTNPPGPANPPLFALNNNTAGTDDCRNTDRNPLFRYQGIQRLGNLTTTRSNVFAVWITVGYFQVQPPPKRFDASGNPWPIAQQQAVNQVAYPDGYSLGQEVGADTGEIKRHRAFYLFDRSIPVGFQRGSDLNVEKAIVLKRYIE